MPCNKNRVAKEAWAVYEQWQRDWVQKLQLSDQSMTWRSWLEKLLKTVYPPGAGNEVGYLWKKTAHGQVVLRDRGYKTASMNPTTYLWTSQSSVSIHLEDLNDFLDD